MFDNKAANGEYDPHMSRFLPLSDVFLDWSNIKYRLCVGLTIMFAMNNFTCKLKLVLNLRYLNATCNAVFRVAF